MSGTISGIEIPDECVTAFTDIKTGKKKGAYRCIIYKLEDKKKLVVEKQVPMDCDQEKQYLEIADQLPPTGGRFIMWDMKARAPAAAAGQQATTEKDVLVFMFWMPDSAKVGEKMVMAASLEGIKKKLQGFSHFMAFNNKDELCDYEAFKKEIEKK